MTALVVEGSAGAVGVAAGAVVVAGAAGYVLGTGINQAMEPSGVSDKIDRFLERHGVYDAAYNLFFT